MKMGSNYLNMPAATNGKILIARFFQTIEKDHGRMEIRRYWTMDNVEYLLDSDKWKGLQSIGMVESSAHY